MNRHQVITGAVNSGDHCYSVGTVEGVNFTAYATGCDVVILSSDFQRVQIISGSSHGHVQVTCIDCSSDTGKIAACYGNKVYIYEPVPIFHRVSSHRLDYQWIETNVLICDSVITALSWNQEGTRLLTGGRWIQLWASPVVSEPHVQPPSTNSASQFVSFSLGENDHGEGDSQEKWKEVWRCRTSAPVAHLEFSPDGRFFASVAKGDRLVKVWYRSRKVILPSQGAQFYADGDDEKREYSFVYLPHPRAVTSFSWRKTSRYMPRGAVANMLLTSCLDNICRLWVETMLPDDGLLNMQHLDPLVTQNPKYGQHRHKRRLVERLRHMRKSFRRARTQGQHDQQPSSTGVPSSGTGNTLAVKKEPVPTLPSSYSVHDFHKVGVHGTGVSPECHFHLAASINADTDIPLVPLLSSGSGEPLSFVIHWLNNKDMHFTWQAENLLHDLCKKALRSERHDDLTDHRAASPDPLEFEEEQEDAELGPTPNGQLPQTMPSKSKKSEKSMNKFSSLRKKLPKMGQRTKSFDLLDEDVVSVTSSHRERGSLQPQPSVIGSTAESQGSAPGDTLDREIENLVRNWHHSADLLFSIHPLDGSFLVWVVEWLDEEYPGAFRQPQVSFSARIPNALPLGDSVTTCCNLEVYSTHSAFLDLYSMIKLTDDKSSVYQHANDEPPIVSMISCHQNGSLNLWRINFSDVTEFSAVVSVGHESRICGHRFRVNDMVSHPVLPLLLTTSHHNESSGKPKTPAAGRKMSQALLNFTLGKGFCSELILWKVEPVGPLSKSGGVTELARINSAALSAFSSCAWLPTLLPGWTLGNLSQTPSACFVASDGVSLRLYQAVIDAQLLLAEMYASLRKPSVARSESTVSNASSAGQSLPEEQMDMFNIVSLQSSARPGCILALDHVNEAKHDWQNTQFLHIFHEHVLRGKTSDSNARNLEAVVDLTNLSNFEEYFYLTVLEKNPRGGSIMHMWSIALSSKPNQDDDDQEAMSGEEADEDDVPLDDSKMMSSTKLSPSNLKILTSKVCCQQLPLPADIEVVSATAAAGHLSSSAIYPACYAPYSIATACSDGTIRFWRCQIEEPEGRVRSYFWEEWRMMLGHTSCLTVPGKILGLSCAYSARIACAFKASVDHIRHDRDEPQYNMSVAIFECESTGGSEWVQEDKIAIRGVHFAQTASPVPDPEDTLMAIRREKRSMDNLSRLMGMHEGLLPPAPYVNPFKLSNSETKISQKPWQSVSLDWVSMEDGSHVLTVGLGCQIMIFAAVSNDIAQENMKAMAETVPNTKRSVLRQASSFALPAQKGIYRWMRLRLITLDQQDGAPALPNQMAWVRTGLLVLGMDNEMYVYSQWRKSLDASHPDMSDARCLSDYNLIRLNASPSRMKINKTIPSLMSVEHLKKMKSRKTMTQMSHISKRTNILQDTFVMDRGLFEAARIASPVLPQYHPKQLMELLNFGRLRRVQAILAHLLRCIKSALPSSDDGNDFPVEDQENGRRSSLSRQLSMSRRKSVVLSPGSLGDAPNKPKEEITLDYIEIDSISPLPLFALLEADHYVGKRGDEDENYDALFNAENENGDEATLDDILDDEDGTEEQTRKKRTGARRDPSDIYAFHPNDARELVHHLTHMHLPGLSSLDQMHLLALADTVANCSGTLILDTEDDAAHAPPTPENVDSCGLRYLLAVRQHVYLLRCLPLKQRAAIQKQGIESRYIAWAFHSENQQELLNAVQNIVHGELKWSDIKELGIGWWLRSNAIFKNVIERLAKNAYQASQEPMDAALYYLAMKRKPVLHALFKVVKDQKMMDFFSNDFTQDRWRKAALKNAFVLLGKQRFEHAAAFFILGSAVKDAVDIILSKLGDMQLALMVVRLYEEDEFGIISENHVRILQDHVLEPLHEDMGSTEPDQVAPCNDPFLQSISHWTLRQYSQSLQVLLAEEAMDLTMTTENHSIFNFYDFLRNHPIVVRQVQTSTKVHRKDEISSVERKLFFKTAHVYFRAGCPLLALEVLCKLPEYFYDEVPDLTIDVKGMNGLDSVKESAPAAEPQTVQDFDWGTPSVTVAAPKEDKLELSWDDEEKEEDEDDDDHLSDRGSVLEFGSPKRRMSTSSPHRRASILSNVQDLSKRVDIMAQQLKFIAGLKILMEELGTLATGFEVDGGQLRLILYMWLEKEVGILKLLCYKSGAALNEKLRAIKPIDAENDERMMSGVHHEQLALHEALKVDNMDFEARLDRMARRKAWLKSNQQLLRSLIHFCQIYGSNGGGLASVYMELTLLAHELYQGSLQQQQQLLTPLPFLTTLPLLSAFITGPLTISSDPVTYVSRMSHDLLYTLADRKAPPAAQEPITSIYVIRDLASALSSIVYQSLCEGDQFQTKNFHSSSGALEGFAATLLNSGGYMFTMQRKRRNTMIDGRLVPTTQPSKWPGVQALRALMARERDENAPKLHVLLMETYIAVYMSMIVTGVALRDVSLLYRLVGVNFNVKTWSSIFGGGAKKVIRRSSSDRRRSFASTNNDSRDPAKQRNLLNAKVLGHLRPNSTSPPTAPSTETSVATTTYQEVFVPPETSILASMLAKPNVDTSADPPFFDYDSDESVPSDDEDNPPSEIEFDEESKRAESEHSDPNSYSWAIVRLVVLKAAAKVIQQVLTTVAVEQQDLPVFSPVLHTTLKMLDHWQLAAIHALEEFGAAPEGFIPRAYGGFGDTVSGKKNPYAVLLDPSNTPFQSDHPSASPMKRLWNYLIHQDYLQETFVKYMFKRRKPDLPSLDTLSDLNSVDEAAPRPMRDAIRIVHKDQDIVTAFTINHANQNLIALSTSKEIQEINIASLLDPEGWLQDESEFNLLTMKNQALEKTDPEFLVLQTPTDQPPANARSTAASLLPGAQVSTRGAYVLNKRPYKEVRRLTSHPMLPYYLSGSADGSIRLWEFGHQKQLTTLRSTSNMAKINHLEFSSQGNKFAACDADGVVSFWQLGTSSSNAPPFISLQCHNKTCSAFTFLGSSSLIATAGHASESRNVAIWDTLLPPRKAMVAAFICHDTGSSSLVYASQHNLLITCGKKGDVCLFDMRQRQLRHKFQAHESGIRAVALDPTQEYFVTGSAEGDIKVWGLSVHNCLVSLPEEHKKQSFFRNSSSGVMQLSIDAQNRLFSCGADGFFKIRTLQPQDYIVHTL
ncbi:dmX-like protein 2 isoform X2 [Paramacrobiotus metropolitanus]|uniref:dmX-like protein 2 isoform X2 n=1 Tax=Paramacrobiotus metropolitanus TaxID=2943436 RepID=UPI0024456786|nr:dmX-like protein 2 isoform X2 [Paramacrobiotus metropolitanus]